MCLTWLKLPLKVLWFAHDIVMQSLCYTDVWEAAPVFYVSCLGVQPHGMKNSCMEILVISAMGRICHCAAGDFHEQCCEFGGDNKNG